MLAVETFAARRGIRGDDTLADTPTFRFRVNLGDNAGKFVTEDGGWHDHFCVVPAPEDFEVGSAGQRGMDGDPDLSGLKRRSRDIFNPDVLFSIEYSSTHAL
jgi:hypothetical protein